MGKFGLFYDGVGLFLNGGVLNCPEHMCISYTVTCILLCIGSWSSIDFVTYFIMYCKLYLHCSDISLPFCRKCNGHSQVFDESVTESESGMNL